MFEGPLDPLYFGRNIWWMGPLVFLDLILRGLALWKSAKANRQYWFVGLLLINSMGILPAIYLYFIDRKTAKKSK